MLVPNHLREASYALGVSKWRTVLQRRAADCLRRHPHRDDARDRPRRRRDGAAPLHLRDRRAGHRLGSVAFRRLDSVTIFQYSESPDRAARAGLGSRVRADHVRARHEPARALLLDRSQRKHGPRAVAARLFTTPSPHWSQRCQPSGAQPRQAGATTSVQNPRDKERTSMKRGLALIAASLVALTRDRSRRREATTRRSRARAARSSRRSSRPGRRRSARRSTTRPVQRRRLRRRHRRRSRTARSTSAPPTRR